MKVIVKHFKWIMIFSGVITCSMFLSLFSPQAGLLTTFGATLEGDLSNIVVRNWGALIGMVGCLLVYGAYHLESRPLVLAIAIFSKSIFIFLVLIFGQAYLEKAALAVVFDSIVILLFSIYLYSQRKVQ
ncbi:hypothetical protein EHQ58_12255 [Leptospira ognonensis]|uniref:DUF2127 domain-containing protein n=1 Tax=Leptospira ognonensis TaxID=2484945 RepID=A0A4R9JY48_9LEPT|nr:hypothetical protein [Leptospira ognonensis]TGL58147.1 hypothetical protein EHQ58_12255 [Leptospira ognonensis]